MISTRRIFEICALIVSMILAAMAIHAWLASHDEQLRLQSALAMQKQQLDAADVRERDRAGTLNQTLAEIEKLKREVQTPQQVLRELPQYLNLPQPITLNSTPDAEKIGEVALKENRKGTDRTANSRNADLSHASPGASGPVPSGSTLSATKEAEQQHAGPRHSEASEGLPDPANQSTSASLAKNQRATVPSTISSAEIPAADLKPLYDYIQDCRECQAQLAAAKQNRIDDASKLDAMTRERDAAIIAAKGGTFWRRLRRNAEWFAIGVTAGAAATYASSHRR